MKNNPLEEIQYKDIKLEDVKLVNSMYLVRLIEVKRGLIELNHPMAYLPYKGQVVKVNHHMVNKKNKKIIPECHIGDFIYFGKVSGVPIDIDDVRYQFCDEDFIFAKIKEDTDIKPNFIY